MTKPVVCDTKVTEPGSKPLGTAVPVGTVTPGVMEVVVVVDDVVVGAAVWVLEQAPAATVKHADTTSMARGCTT